MCFSRLYFIATMYKRMILVSTSCALIIHVHSARRKRRLVWYDEFILIMYISISMKSKSILSLFGGLKCLLEECLDLEFLVHYFLLGII